jgi:hypothetical protein
MHNHLASHPIIIFLLVLIVGNLIIIDISLFSTSGIKLSDISTQLSPTPKASSIPSSNEFVCPKSCLALFQQATPSAVIPTTVPNIETKTEAKTPKEYYIPLGTGESDKSDWTDLTATETVIDPGNYGEIREAYFTASLRNPTQNGQVEAQLFNVTDKHIVWGSHVIMNGPVSQTISSQKITLDTGGKLYRVQLKSSMSYKVYLDNAKIRIISK